MESDISTKVIDISKEDLEPSLDRNGYVATIALRRPARHNRLQPADLACMRRYLQQLEGDSSVRALVIAARGPSFSSGFDLSSSNVGADTVEQRAEVVLQHLCDELEDFPLPTVCAINGGIYGGATDLALACDFRIGVKAAKLRMPAAQLGVCFYPSGLRRYVSRLGLATSKRLFLTGVDLEADELERVGFLDAVMEDFTALQEHVARLADRLAALPPIAAAHTKRSLNQAALNELDRDDGERAFRRSLTSQEFADALKLWTQRKS